VRFGVSDPYRNKPEKRKNGVKEEKLKIECMGTQNVFKIV
jgi:hypothetical protein